MPASSGTQEIHLTRVTSGSARSRHVSGASPRVTRCTVHRRYPAVRIVPIPPNTISVRNSPTWANGRYDEYRARTSPQNPASPGRPSDAIAVNQKIAPSFGRTWLTPPPISAICRVWYRSYIEPTSKNSIPVMMPWATIPKIAALIPTSVSVAIPSITNPMWPTEE